MINLYKELHNAFEIDTDYINTPNVIETIYQLLNQIKKVNPKTIESDINYIVQKLLDDSYCINFVMADYSKSELVLFFKETENIIKSKTIESLKSVNILMVSLFFFKIKNFNFSLFFIKYCIEYYFESNLLTISETQKMIKIKSLNLFLLNIKRLNIFDEYLSQLNLFYRTCILNNDFFISNTLILNLLGYLIKIKAYSYALKYIDKSTFNFNASSEKYCLVYLQYTTKCFLVTNQIKKAKQNFMKILQFFKNSNKKIYSLNYYNYSLKLGIILSCYYKNHLPFEIYDIVNKFQIKLDIVYLCIYKAVITGSLKKFNLIIDESFNLFIKDGFYNVIYRLKYLIPSNSLILINKRFQNTKIEIENLLKTETLSCFTKEDLKYVIMKNIKEENIFGKLEENYLIFYTYKNKG